MPKWAIWASGILRLEFIAIFWSYLFRPLILAPAIAGVRRYLYAGALAGGLLLSPSASAEEIRVSVEPIPLLPADTENLATAPIPQKVGALIFRGGFALRAVDRRFGGFSGLVVSPDGQRLTAVSDDGNRLDAGLAYDAKGWLTNLTAANLSPLLSPSGRALGYKRVRDAEALAIDLQGNLIVAFEHDHRLWRYRDGRPSMIRGPKAFLKMPANRGLEALTVLRDGRLLAISEGLRLPSDDFQGWILSADEKSWDRIEVVHHRSYRPTGAATLPNGDVILLERWFSRLAGFAARLRHIPRAHIRAGARLVGTEIAVIDSPMTIDNYEGIAARSAANGKTHIYLLSDDNFNGLQRTLLMMFELTE